MLGRKAGAAAAGAIIALALSPQVATAAPAPDPIPDAPVTTAVQGRTGEPGGAALWVGVATGLSGVAALAYSVRRPRTSGG